MGIKTGIEKSDFTLANRFKVQIPHQVKVK